jgi:SNF2 family DNA or RNA helicase
VAEPVPPPVHPHGQIYVLDQGHALGEFVTRYRLKYFAPTGYGGYTWVPQAGAEERIYADIAPLVLRMAEKDYLDLPPLIGVEPPHVVGVALPPKARKVYADLEEHLIADVLGEAVTAANVAVASMKCRQVANGGLYSDERKGAWAHLHDAKTDAVAEILEELSGKPALVSVDFHHDAERLRKRFGRNTPYVGAGIATGELRRVIAAWNAGDLPLVLANPQTAARSLNLQAGPGRDLIFHSLTWNYEHYDQFIRRLWRQGQAGRVRVHHIVARGTTDEALLLAIGRKARTQGALLGALRAYARQRPVARRAI